MTIEVDTPALDPMDPTRATALSAIPGAGAQVTTGDPLPAFAHRVYFWNANPHAAETVVWVGGKVVLHAPLLAGFRAERTVTTTGFDNRVRQDIRQRQSLVRTEWLDLAPDGDLPPLETVARHDAEVSQTLTFTGDDLFRFAALTFNPDQRFMNGGTIPPALLMHILLAMGQARMDACGGFSYRIGKALSVSERVTFCLSGRDLWLHGPDGRPRITARAL